MDTNRLAFTFEVKAIDEETRTLEGWASIFGNVDAGNDIVMPGAFAKTLSRRKASDKVVLLWQHDTKAPIGIWTELREIDQGLYGKAKISKTARGDEAYELIKDGAVKGLSIGYATRQYEMDAKKGTRKLTELDLYEVSLVTFPMNDKAQVTRVKSVSEMTEREFEKYLREGGLSDDAAKIVIDRGFKALGNQREAGAEEQTQLRELRDILTNFKV